MRRSLALLVLTLASCDQAPDGPAQRIALDIARPSMPDVMAQSPDTEGAAWTVDEGGQAIEFGKAGEPALMSLACQLGDDTPQVAIIRHAPARPGLSALFPVIGNGMRSRFFVDAKLADGEWRWEGSLPADDPQLEVFTGRRDLTATLPGRGMLEIDGSRIPGEFITWCRAGGLVMDAQAAEEERAGET